MNLETYNRSYDRLIEIIDEESENRLREIRQQCIREFIGRLEESRNEWDAAYDEILRKSKETEFLSEQAQNQIFHDKPVTKPSLFNLDCFKITTPSSDTKQQEKDEVKPVEEASTRSTQPDEQAARAIPDPASTSIPEPVAETKVNVGPKSTKFDDPLFGNSTSIKNFVKVQEVLAHIRQSFKDFNENPSYKSYKNELAMFIRTQINSISNSDSQHLDTKIKLLSSLFAGQKVSYQEKFIDANQHPQARTYALDLTAQTFVTVGTRLVNSVPAIAKSMALVINGIVKNNLELFKQLVIGHLQERCPYLIPMLPDPDHIDGGNEKSIKYKIACGYNYDLKSQTLESDDKYMIRMRSMVLIYSCILVEENIGQAWTWLASFISLEPQPVISATILQAFLQEISKQMSKVYLCQYTKLISFIKDHYIKMVEEVTSQTTDVQSFVKLKNLLNDDSNLFASPSVNSIFGTIRF